MYLSIAALSSSINALSPVSTASVYDRFTLRVGVGVIVVRVLVLLVLRYIFTRGFLMTVDYAVAVVMIKAVVRSVHTVPPKK